MADELKLSRIEENLNTIRNIKEIGVPIAGIVNSVTCGSVMVFGGISMLHNTAGHIELASRYFGATQAIMPFAMDTLVATAVVSGAVVVAEKIQQHKLSEMQYSMKWKKIMHNNSVEKAVESVKSDSIAKEVEKEKEIPKEVYKPFSSVLKSKQKVKEKTLDRDITME